MLSKQQTGHTQDAGADPPPEAWSHSGRVPLRTPFVPAPKPPNPDWSCPTQNRIVPKTDQGRECKQGVCSRPIRQRGVLGLPSPEGLRRACVSLFVGFPILPPLHGLGLPSPEGLPRACVSLFAGFPILPPLHGPSNHCFLSPPSWTPFNCLTEGIGSTDVLPDEGPGGLSLPKVAAGNRE